MRLGIFGGSFDPVHNGHLEIARCCQRQAALDAIWFTPTAVQPLKQNGPHATDAQRCEMLELAIGSAPSEREWRVCTLEIDRGGVSYTVDTLRQIHEELPDATLFFLMGADALCDVPQWKEPAEIFRLSTPLVVRRSGDVDPNLNALLRICAPDKEPLLVEMPAIDLSSTEIRRRIGAGEPIAHVVPAAVAEYIAAEELYQ